MKSLTARRCSMTISGILVACLAFAAHGAANVFDDAVFWFRGGKDVSGDGYMRSQGEFFDDLQANDPAHDNHKMAMSSTAYTGQLDEFKKNVVFRQEPVVFPALGKSIVKEMQVLHISDEIVVSGGKNWYYPFDVKPRSLFERYAISNEYTVVSRIRLDDDTFNREVCLLKIGYDDSAKQGMWLGFAKRDPASAKYRRITGHCTPNSSGVDRAFNLDLPVPTNTWVDVAVVVGNGKLRVGIAAPESLSTLDNNPTIAFAETDMWTDNCTLLNAENYRLFCKIGQTAAQQASGTDQSAFIGSVQQMAIWGRALSDQEVMAAFGMPHPAIFRTGFDNGASNEFGGTRTSSTQTVDGLGSWQGVWNTMKAGDVWTVNFTALRDEANLPQIFSIKSLRSSSVQIEVTLNNASLSYNLGENRVSSNGRTFWPVPADKIKAGANALVIKRKDGGALDFLIDAMELGGSLGVGKLSFSSTDDGRVDPERIKTGVPSAADPNTQHWPTKLDPSTGITNLHFRVWVDPDVADKATFSFKTAVLNDTASGEAFSVYVNRNRRIGVNAKAEWKSYTFNPGVLNGGWNDFDFRTTTSCRSEFGCFHLETSLPKAFGYPRPLGLAILVK